MCVLSKTPPAEVLSELNGLEVIRAEAHLNTDDPTTVNEAKSALKQAGLSWEVPVNATESVGYVLHGKAGLLRCLSGQTAEP